MHSYSLKEKKEHSLDGFPVAYYHVEENHPEYKMITHWHSEWEIIRVSRGELLIEADNETFNMEKGDILILPGAVVHSGIPTDCCYECVCFDLNGLFSQISPIWEDVRLFSLQVLRPTMFFKHYNIDIYPIVNHLFFCLQSQTLTSASRLAVFADISRVYSVLYDKKYYTDNKRDMPKPLQPIYLKKVLEYIENNYGSTITVNDMANIAQMSPKYFFRYFRSCVNQSPIEYLRKTRIQKAAEMLRNTNLTVSEIGALCGFNDTAYFVRVFKRYMDMTPKAFSNTILGSEQ